MNARIQSSFELMRFGRSVVTALIVLPLSWRLAHYVVFLVFLLLSFAFNDLVDREMDKDGHPDRPLPSGRLMVGEACLISVGLFLVGCCFAYAWAKDLLLLFVYASGASAIYSWILKRHVPLMATPLWSLTVTVVVCLPTGMSANGWGIFFFILYIHEVLLDMRDAQADRIHCTTPSIATLLGPHCWWYVLALFLIAANLVEFGYAMKAIGNPSVVIWSGLMQFSVTVLCLYLVYEVATSDWEEMNAVVVGTRYFKSLFLLSVLLV